jgi:hypothetical protein
LTIPSFGIQIARHRLTRPYFDRCTITTTLLGPEDAKTAGFRDKIEQPDRVMPAAEAAAQALTVLDRAPTKRPRCVFASRACPASATESTESEAETGNGEI